MAQLVPRDDPHDSSPIDVKAFAALGSKPRANLIIALLEAPQRPSDLQFCLDKPLALWYHIGPLVRSGIVVVNRIEPKKSMYYLNVARLHALAMDLRALAECAPPLPEGLVVASPEDAKALTKAETNGTHQPPLTLGVLV